MHEGADGPESQEGVVMKVTSKQTTVHPVFRSSSCLFLVHICYFTILERTWAPSSSVPYCKQTFATKTNGK